MNNKILVAHGLLFSFFLSSCQAPPKEPAAAASTSPEATSKTDRFPGMDACVLIYDLKNEKWIEVQNEERCRKRYAACSTFKVPLAAMAFDSGTLKDENTSYKWDGKKRSIEAWNKDQTAETWMKESVVWYSQVVTRKMGRKRVQNYLNKFDYGSKDFSGDIETAWLTPAPFLKNPAPPTVLISGYEQIDFMKKLWQNKLPISERAAALTKKITFVETSPNGFKLYGKTGSGFLNKEETLRIGWFIAHLEKGDQSYVGVVTFNDLVEQPPGTFGGAFSREKMKEAFKEKGLF